MTVGEVVKNLKLEVFSGSTHLEKKISGGYCSDLLSDVMGNASEGNVWITLQVHKNIMAVATLKDLAAIVLVKGLKPDKEIRELSEQEGIPLLGTHETAFEIAGQLYQLLRE